jgi:hypothetical protein
VPQETWEKNIGLPLNDYEPDVVHDNMDGSKGGDSGDGGDGGRGVSEFATFGQGDGWKDLIQLIRAQAMMRGWLERRAVKLAKAATAEANERARHIQRRIQRKNATERYFGEGRLGILTDGTYLRTTALSHYLAIVVPRR